MNTNKLKAYAPKARLAFMDAVKKRAAVLGIYENKISDATTQGTDTLIEGRIFTRKQGQQRQQLVNRIEALGGGKDGYNQFINEMAFTWFNRFTAIRFMEVNGYLDHGFRMLSKEEDAEFSQGFEILAHAADVAEDLGLNKADIVEMLLAGDKEEELYRELLLAQCHQLSKIMPFMFEKLDDATELLLPDNLTKTDSILKELINDVPEDNWQEIEVIGWLYQFYISEHKDAVIGKVVKKEDIPAATQLFTPNWIVKYLVQNSLGRQWLATYPDSDLKEKMEYYITPAEQSDEVIEQLKAITPTSIDPEQIKVLDPACGSGHILVEVYEVLRDIYLERGYRLREIPELILTKNIYGLDIDDRAAQMAAFAVLMKAREDDRRIFSRIEDNQLELNIHSIQSTEHLDINQLWKDLDLDENKQTGSMEDLFAEQSVFVETSAKNQQYLDLLRYLKEQFIDGKNLGSLINIDNKYLEILKKLKSVLKDKLQDSSPTVRDACEKLLLVVQQSEILAEKYSICVANPPYLGQKGMNLNLKTFAKNHFPNSKSDLFSLFMERAFDVLDAHGFNAQVNMQSWMFLSSFEKLRESLIDTKTFITMAHLGPRAFGQISGEVVQTTAWVIQKTHIDGFIPSFLRLIEGNETGKKLALLNKLSLHAHTKQDDFRAIPGSTIAYWVTDDLRRCFKKFPALADFAKPRQGLATSDNNRFLRLWHEVNFRNVCLNATSHEEAALSKRKWFPCQKGGGFKKWYGNHDYLVNWENDGAELLEFAASLYGSPTRTIKNIPFYFKSGLTWSTLTSSGMTMRYSPSGFISETKGAICFFDNEKTKFKALAILNSSVINPINLTISPTLDFHEGPVGKLPINIGASDELVGLAKKCVDISKADYDSYETSWDFTFNLPRQEGSLEKQCQEFIRYWEAKTLEIKSLEESINNIVISDYGLENEVGIDVDLAYISLDRNKYFSFADVKDLSVINKKQIVSLVKECLSFSVGCSMGRFSLDRDGLVYAYSGNKGFKELVTEGAYKTFPADDDGIIPLAAEEWLFDDDATSLFRDFVKTVWGEKHLQENLDFVAESLCLDAIKPKKNESSIETIRRYFSTQFYKEHLKTYKKRPIYWLFSSGKEKAFECLVYLHRYNESTLARMRTEYVTPLMGKLETQHSVLTESRTNASSSEQRRIDKELKSIEKKQSELRAFDEELKHLAEMKISIDLDDGVKVNYGKFGNLLADVKAIHGKNPEELK